jgi:hypothetical protein
MATKSKIKKGAGKVKNATRPQIIEAAERRAYVIEQRKGGNSYRLIAEVTIAHFGLDTLPKNYDARYAHDDVTAELKRIREQSGEAAEDVLTMELERLDRMQAALWGEIVGQGGRPVVPHLRDSAIDRVLKLMKRRADLLGLDAPAKSDFTSGGDKVQTVIYLPDNGRADPE